MSKRARMSVPQTLVEKIFSSHTAEAIQPGSIVDLAVDVRCARDFAGANVVKHMKTRNLPVADPSKTFFTFDCNPGGSDQKYAANQHACRLWARENGVKVFDITQGIGTHQVIEKRIVRPGDVFLSTDSHANILGAIGSFGQGMGDVDIAASFTHGRVWFKVPKSAKLVLRGTPGPNATPKDVILRILSELGAGGLLGYACEVTGPYADALNLSGRITMASMGTEMAAIILLFPPTREVLAELGYPVDEVASLVQQSRADEGAVYERTIEVDIEGLTPYISYPGHPEATHPVETVRGQRIDSAFIGSCTNGRYEDICLAAQILRGRRVAPHVVLKIVPSTRATYERLLREGVLQTLYTAGALIGNAGCAGCADGQIGQNGPGEVTVSTGNRNFTGKQGRGKVYLASPATVAASAIAGVIATADAIPDAAVEMDVTPERPEAPAESSSGPARPDISIIRGRLWFVDQNNIDTDMIFHNSHLAITDIEEMGQHAFGNLSGWTDFSKKARPGDIVLAGANFGCGSSRQQAVDCFTALGISLLLARSYGAIYERNAINAGVPMTTIGQEAIEAAQLRTGDEIEVDVLQGTVRNLTRPDAPLARCQPLAKIQLEIYQRGGLLSH